MNILNSYIRSKLDLSHIGLQRGEKESGHFCTPVLSRVIGWAGVDGIHFCTTKDDLRSEPGELSRRVCPPGCQELCRFPSASACLQGYRCDRAVLVHGQGSV